jgi:hypothetical protein
MISAYLMLPAQRAASRTTLDRLVVAGREDGLEYGDADGEALRNPLLPERKA